MVQQESDINVNGGFWFQLMLLWYAVGFISVVVSKIVKRMSFYFSIGWLTKRNFIID